MSTFRVAMPLEVRTDWDSRAWRSPAFEPLRDVLSVFESFSVWPSVEQLNACLGPHLQAALGDTAPVFERQQKPPKRRRQKQLRTVSDLYDGRIFEAGRIPTRENNWHDFLNACVWAWLPRTKKALSNRQYQAARERLPQSFDALPAYRTREQDALALMDEGGVLTSVDGQSTWIFGHAIYEHLLSSSEPVRGFSLLAPSFNDAETFDRLLAAKLEHRDWPSLGQTPELWVSAVGARQT